MSRKINKYVEYVIMGIIVIMIIIAIIIQIRKTSVITQVNQLHNGDAKLYNDYIITSVDGHFTIYNLQGEKVKEYPEIMTNWMSCLEDEGIVVYGNGNCQIGILQLDKDLNVQHNEVVMQTENLQIDPTIIKINNIYYITVTEIIGTVNNADVNVENGRYILHLMRSKDLSNWTLVSDVVDSYSNIEDVDIDYENDKFYISYEKETVDKGDSSIELAISDDSKGNKFSKTIELLKADCDHEPAAFERIDGNTYRLYYSCDKNYRGESYQGGQVFYADYDSNWNQLSVDNIVKTETEKGILLYDVKEENGNLRLLYARNYLTDCDMIVEKIKK